MKWEVYFQEKAASCMDEMKMLASKGGAEGQVLYVGSQTAGRGRHDREWSSPAGGLYCALLLRPKWSVEDITKVTLLVGVAARETVKKMSGVEAKIKWPNDLIIGKKKLAGILAESEVKGDKIEFIVVGVGINVNTDPKDLPEEAISIRKLTKREYDLRKFLDTFLNRMSYWYEKTSRHGFDAVLNRWRHLCGTIGQRILVKECGYIEGDVYDIAEDGGLLIEQDDGWIMKIINGDVTVIHENKE